MGYSPTVLITKVLIGMPILMRLFRYCSVWRTSINIKIAINQSGLFVTAYSAFREAATPPKALIPIWLSPSPASLLYLLGILHTACRSGKLS